MDNCLTRCAPEDQGISSASILGFIEAAEKNIRELHSFMLLRRGFVVAEGWWSPYRPERPHMLFSLSKSFTSTAVGLAVMENFLSVDDPVVSFFPDELPAKISDNLRAMRVRHLLSMSTGHHLDTTDRMARRRDGNWVRGFLKLKVEHAPGTHFVYNSGASYMLSAIVQKVTGLKVVDYLGPRLFEPLGIDNAVWETSPQGINVGGWGLTLKTEDIARFGQLYLQKGLWERRRILPEWWVTDATSRQVSNGTNPDSDWEQGYGFQFWRCRHGAYRGDGAFGQYCVVMPDQEAVLAITSGVGDMQAVLNLVWQHLLPAMEGAAPHAADTSGAEQLRRKASTLAYLPPQGERSSALAAQVAGKTFTLEANELKLKSIAFDFSEAGCTMTIRNPKGAHTMTGGLGSWQEGETAFFGLSPKFVGSGTWTAADTFVMTLRFYETPFVYTTTCKFAGDRVTIDADANVAFGPTHFPLVGHAA